MSRKNKSKTTVDPYKGPGYASRTYSGSKRSYAVTTRPKMTKEQEAQFKLALIEGQAAAVSYNKDTYTPSNARVEIITAKNGIFKRENHPCYTVTEKISSHGNEFLDDFTDSCGVKLKQPKMPWITLLLTYSFFSDIFEGKHGTRAGSEAMIQWFYAPDGFKEDEDEEGILKVPMADGFSENWFGYIPLQNINAASVNYERNAMLETKYRCVADIHSHDSMSAFFSGTDDADEVESRFYGVFGLFPWENTNATICRYQRVIGHNNNRIACSFFSFVQYPDGLIDEGTPNMIMLEKAIQKLPDHEIMLYMTKVYQKEEISQELIERAKKPSVSSHKTRATGFQTWDAKLGKYVDSQYDWDDGYGYGYGGWDTAHSARTKTSDYRSTFRKKIIDQASTLLTVEGVLGIYSLLKELDDTKTYWLKQDFIDAVEEMANDINEYAVLVPPEDSEEIETMLFDEFTEVLEKVLLYGEAPLEEVAEDQLIDDKEKLEILAN